jgi:hypothetical protein
VRNLTPPAPAVKRIARTPEQWGQAYDPVTGATVKLTTPAQDVARLERTVSHYRKIEAKHAELRAAGGTVRSNPQRDALHADARRRLASARIALAREQRMNGQRRSTGRPRSTRAARAPRRASRRPARKAVGRAGPSSDGPPSPSPEPAHGAIGGVS